MEGTRITKEEYEIYEKVKNRLERRADQIFELLKGIEVGWTEYYEGCTISGGLTFRIGGNYRGEYDYEEHWRPLDYLFMNDNEIVNAEEKREEELKRKEELEKKEEEKRIRDREIEQLKELKKKYPHV